MTAKTGTANLAGVIDHAARRRASRPPAFDLGTIQTGGALLLDSFKVPIPAGDFLVDERFTQPATVLTTENALSGPDTHSHTIQRAGTVFRALATGDRVVCLLLDPDSDEPTPVVVGRLAP
jgi:hypothetical protein